MSETRQRGGNLYTLLSYKEVGHTVTDEELRNAFHRLVDCWIPYESIADDYEDDALARAEEIDRQRELIEDEILSTLSRKIQRIIVEHNPRTK